MMLARRDMRFAAAGSVANAKDMKDMCCCTKVGSVATSFDPSHTIPLPAIATQKRAPPTPRNAARERKQPQLRESPDSSSRRWDPSKASSRASFPNMNFEF